MVPEDRPDTGCVPVSAVCEMTLGWFGVGAVLLVSVMFQSIVIVVGELV